MSEKVHVALGARSYDVSIGAFTPDAIAETIASALDPKTTGVAVLVDEQVAEKSARARDLIAALAKRLPRVDRLDLRAGEACKNLAEIEKSCEWLAAHGIRPARGRGGHRRRRRDRPRRFRGRRLPARRADSRSCRRRCWRWSTRPSGGKTGVDLGAGKNLVGAFHQPRAVVADVGFLETLPARERIAGLAEVVKCGFIADAGLLDLLEQSGRDLTVAQHQEVITRAVRVKADVVASDETESGRRAILNFGHTVGHALEAASGYGLLHGEAVALGMVAALDLGRWRWAPARPRWLRARAACSRGWACRSTTNGGSTRRRRPASPSTRNGAGRRSVSSWCPRRARRASWRFAPADIASHLIRRIASRPPSPGAAKA
jgi:3-dehydroquinate synthase